jgi:hypothetical protein
VLTGLEEATASSAPVWPEPGVSAVLDEQTGLLGGRFLAKSLGQVADLGFWVAAVAAEGLQEG